MLWNAPITSCRLADFVIDGQGMVTILFDIYMYITFNLSYLLFNSSVILSYNIHCKYENGPFPFIDCSAAHKQYHKDYNEFFCAN
jgi:hypothetical protein